LRGSRSSKTAVDFAGAAVHAWRQAVTALAHVAPVPLHDHAWVASACQYSVATNLGGRLTRAEVSTRSNASLIAV
jgi:hypothetical protein